MSWRNRLFNILTPREPNKIKWDESAQHIDKKIFTVHRRFHEMSPNRKLQSISMLDKWISEQGVRVIKGENAQVKVVRSPFRWIDQKNGENLAVIEVTDLFMQMPDAKQKEALNMMRKFIHDESGELMRIIEENTARGKAI